MLRWPNLQRLPEGIGPFPSGASPILGWYLNARRAAYAVLSVGIYKLIEIQFGPPETDYSWRRLGDCAAKFARARVRAPLPIQTPPAREKFPGRIITRPNFGQSTCSSPGGSYDSEASNPGVSNLIGGILSTYTLVQTLGNVVTRIQTNRNAPRVPATTSC